MLGLALIASVSKAESYWQDISQEVAKILDMEAQVVPWYIKKGSRKRIKSVEQAGTIYESAEFSYTSGDITTRKKFFVDCKKASYKDSLTNSGYLDQMTYITFDGDKLYNGGDFDGWVAYKYLCPGAKNPWIVIAENSRGEKYGINMATTLKLKSSPYKHSYFYIASKIDEPRSPELIGLYVSCKPKRVEFRPIYDLVNYFPKSEELNPDSIGEEIASIICEAYGHK